MIEEKYMRRAIGLAKNGVGRVDPNPLVGAVIVKDGEVTGEGYHARYGELHAERNAFASLNNKEDAKGATIYVTLEPCCHHGKTPPCTEAIIEHGIAKVVIGSRDPNPKVAGGGVKALREAGIEVVEDFLKEECDRLNPVFFHYIMNKTPYVVMKYAMTADGKIATVSGDSQWITNEDSRARVQEMRNRYAGIMCGIGTVIADDPMLNCRIEGGRSPVRIVCDTSLRIPLESKIVKSAGEYRTIVACGEGADVEKEKALVKEGVEVWRMSPHPSTSSGTGHEGAGTGHGGTGTGEPVAEPVEAPAVDLSSLMKRLGVEGIASVMIEGGGVLNESALKAGIVNEINVFVGAKIFGGKDALTPLSGEGVKAVSESFCLELAEVEVFGDDVLMRYRVK